MSIGSLYQIKNQSLTYQPLLLATFTFLNGDELNVCTHNLTGISRKYSITGDPEDALEYHARITNQDIATTQALSEDGIDITPSVTMRLADADGLLFRGYETGENAPGFKGATLTLRFVMVDMTKNNDDALAFSSDSIRSFVGICNPAELEDEGEISVTAVSKMNMRKKMLPIARIQKTCPWPFPPLEVQEAHPDGYLQDSPYFYCGYRNLEFNDCEHTPEDCAARGNLRNTQVDSGLYVRNGRFGGILYDLVDADKMHWKGKSFIEGINTEGVNNPNKAKYGDYVPHVYGMTWVDGVVLNVVGDANTTRGEVLVTLCQVDNIERVIVNDTEVPAGYLGNYGEQVRSAREDKDWNVFRWQFVDWGQPEGWASQDDPYKGRGDNYGNMCVISFCVPRQVTSSDSVPRVRILVRGPLLPTFPTGDVNNLVMRGHYYFNEGSSQLHYGNSNPAWILLDVLVKSGWSYDEIDLSSFAAAADYCDENITYNSGMVTPDTIDPDTGEVLVAGGQPIIRSDCRFEYSFSLRQRKSAADVIRALRMGMNALLRPNSNGKLAVMIKQKFAQQQPNPVYGSNAETTFLSGWPAYWFHDEDVLRSGEGPEGKSTLKIKQLMNQQAPNKISVQFQNKHNGFSNDTLTITDNEDLNRSGENDTSLAVEGPNTYYHAARIIWTIMGENMRGNPNKTGKGTLQFHFETSMKAVHLQIGDLCVLELESRDIEPIAVRVMSIQPMTNFERCKIVLQWHDDDWYDDEYTPGYRDGMNWKRNTLARAALSWCPYEVQPDTSDPLQDETDWSFGVAQLFDNDASGVLGIPRIRVYGKMPINSFAPGLRPPLTPMQGEYTAGGNFPAPNKYYVGIAAKDESGAWSPVSDLVTVDVLQEGGLQVNNLIWDAGSVGGAIFVGANPNLLSHCDDIDGTPESVTTTNYQVRSWGAPDIEADRLMIKAKKIFHAGVFGAAVTEVNSGSIKIDNNFTGWEENVWQGRKVSIISNQDVDGPIRLLDYTVVGNTADELLLDPSPQIGEVEIGDAVIMRTKVGPSSTEEIIVDESWVSPSSFYGEKIPIVDVEVDGDNWKITLEDQGQLMDTDIYDNMNLLVSGVDGLINFNGLWLGGDPATFITRGNSTTEIVVGRLDGESNPDAIVSGEYLGGGFVRCQARGLRPGDEVGRLLRVLSGTGKGQTMSIKDNDATSITLQKPLGTRMDETSVYIIEDSTWAYEQMTTFVDNGTFDTPIDVTFPIDNFQGEAMLLIGTVFDGGNNESFEHLAPLREVFLVGRTNFLRDMPIRFIITENPMTVRDDAMSNHYVLRCDSEEYLDLTDLSIQAKTAPGGGNASFDILYSVNNGVDWTSILTDPVVLLSTKTKARYRHTADTPLFAQSKLERDYILRLDIKGIGSSPAGGEVEIVLKGKLYRRL